MIRRRSGSPASCSAMHRLEDPSGTVPGWVMVFADSFISVANRAADLVNVVWISGKAAPQISERVCPESRGRVDADRSVGSLAGRRSGR